MGYSNSGQSRGWIGSGSGKSLPCPIPCTVYGLQLFTAYILVQACTSGGCGQSNSSSLKTLQAMPTSQAAPNVTALNAVTALSNPNGLLIQYDVWDRGAPLLGKPHPLEVFDLRLLYIPHPRFTVNTTCIRSPAHAACCVSICRCHTPCIAMKINVRHM